MPFWRLISEKLYLAQEIELVHNLWGEKFSLESERVCSTSIPLSLKLIFKFRRLAASVYQR